MWYNRALRGGILSRVFYSVGCTVAVSSEQATSAVTNEQSTGSPKVRPAGEHMIVNAQGVTTPTDKKSWWRSVVPTFVTTALIGVVFGGGLAWGGSKALIASQDSAIAEIKGSAVALDTRVRVTEMAGVSLAAGNTEQHKTFLEKVTDVKTETTLVKNEVASVKNDVADLKRDGKIRTEATDRKIEDLGKKVDQVLARLR